MNRYINHSGDVCWEFTKKFRRKIPPPQIRYLKKYWNKLLIKGDAFGHGFIVILNTRMVYFYSERKVETKLYRKFWYASTISEIVTGNLATAF